MSSFAKLHAQARTPIWSAVEICGGRPDIDESWSVTSDSLALWLATAIAADRLVLVKSSDIETSDLRALAAAGTIDEAFPGLAERYPGEISFATPAEDGALREVLIAGSTKGLASSPRERRSWSGRHA